MLELAEHFENLARRAVEKKARQVDAQPVIS